MLLCVLILGTCKVWGLYHTARGHMEGFQEVKLSYMLSVRPGENVA